MKNVIFNYIYVDIKIVCSTKVLCRDEKPLCQLKEPEFSLSMGLVMQLWILFGS